MDNNEVVLVTGGSGTVGRGLKELTDKDPQGRKWIFLASKDCDLTDFAATKALFERERPTHVLHLAALIMGRFDMGKRKAELFDINVQINQNVLKCAQAQGVKKLVSCLSSTTYPGSRLSQPEDILEAELHNGPLADPVAGYAGSKRMLDIYTKCIRQQYGLDFVTVCPTNIFGTTATLREDGPLFEANLAKVLAAKAAGEPMKVWGTGKPQRQLVYSKDLAKMLLWALDNYSEDETINMTGPLVSVSEIVETIAKCLKFEGAIEYMSDKPDGPLRVAVSDAKFQRLCPDFKSTPFEVAAAEIVTQHLSKS